MNKAIAGVLLTRVATANAALSGGPRYDANPKERESVLRDLIAWLPGEWLSFPQISMNSTKCG